jgi:hypothetical protein
MPFVRIALIPWKRLDRSRCMYSLMSELCEAAQRQQEDQEAALPARPWLQKARASRRRRLADARQEAALPGECTDPLFQLMQPHAGLSDGSNAICRALRRKGSKRVRHIAIRKQCLAILERLTVPSPWANSCIEAVLLQCNRRHLKGRQLAMGSLVHAAARLLWSSFLAWLSAQIELGNAHGLLCLHYIVCDETPTRCRLAEEQQSEGAAHKEPGGGRRACLQQRIDQSRFWQDVVRSPEQSVHKQRTAHHSRAEQRRAEQSRAEQSRAEQSRAEQSRAEQSRAEQSSRAAA